MYIFMYIYVYSYVHIYIYLFILAALYLDKARERKAARCCLSPLNVRWRAEKEQEHERQDAVQWIHFGCLSNDKARSPLDRLFCWLFRYQIQLV